MQEKELYIGVMSGTSLDGVDTALVEISDTGVVLIAYEEFPYPENLKKDVLDIATGQQTNLVRIGELDTKLGHLYAKAINHLLNKNSVSAKQITAIGNHGQTVFHQPCSTTPFTIQMGDANIISSLTNITTIADFRRKDIALGGQGAPLVPAFHRAIFRPMHSSIVVLNIGGIANISVLKPDQPTLGYDTGPGNILMDAWIFEQTGKKYDNNGEYAAAGKVNQALLEQLLGDNYFKLTPPKSTGRELFNLKWLSRHLTKLGQDIAPQDVQTTLTEFSAITIADEVTVHASGANPELLVCGGGSKNRLLMTRLSLLLPDWHVGTTDDKGVNGDYMEAIAFAWLAHQRIHNLPSNLPEVTGASRSVSLGVIYPAE